MSALCVGSSGFVTTKYLSHMKKHTDYLTPSCMVCMLEVEGAILSASNATWGGALNDGLTFDILDDDELN